MWAKPGSANSGSNWTAWHRQYQPSLPGTAWRFPADTATFLLLLSRNTPPICQPHHIRFKDNTQPCINITSWDQIRKKRRSMRYCPGSQTYRRKQCLWLSIATNCLLRAAPPSPFWTQNFILRLRVLQTLFVPYALFWGHGVSLCLSLRLLLQICPIG